MRSGIALRDIVDCNTVGVFLLENDVDYRSKPWIWNDGDSNNIVFVHKSSTLPFVFGPPLVLLDIAILTLKIEKLSEYLDLVAHQNVIGDGEVSQLLKA